jgi:hypothetical protein
MPNDFIFDALKQQARNDSTLSLAAIDYGQPKPATKIEHGATAPNQDRVDSLREAIERNKPVDILLAPLPYDSADKAKWAAVAAEKQVKGEAIAREQAAAKAADKAALPEREALANNIAELRKLFPSLLKDAGVNHNGHLDLYEIKTGLNNKKLSRDEHNMLAILEAGYNQFCWNSHGTPDKFSIDADGVSANSLAMLDKSVNRGIKEDPYFSFQSKSAPAAGAIEAAMLGYSAARSLGGRSHIGLITAGAAVAGALYGEAVVLYQRASGREDQMYDQVQTGYKSFLADFHNGKIQAR